MNPDSKSLSQAPILAEDGQRPANPARKRRKTYLLGICGMLAEILFSLGLIVIGFTISLLCGW